MGVRPGSDPGLTPTIIRFHDAWLVVAVNESSRAQQVVLRRPGSAARVTFDVPAARSRMAMLDPAAWTILDLS